MPQEYFRHLSGQQQPHTAPATGNELSPQPPPPDTDWLPRSIRGKLIVSLVAIAFLGALSTVAALYAMTKVEEKIRIIESFYELNQKILETRRFEKNYLLYSNPVDLASALDYLNEVRTAIDPVSAFLPSAGRMGQPPYHEGLAAYAGLLKQLSRPDLSVAQMEELNEELRRRGHVLTQMVLDLDTAARQRAEEEARRYREMSIITLGTSLMGGALVILLLIRWIIRPLEAIREASARIMRGETTTIPIDASIRGSVEGVELVNSLNLMLDALTAKQNQLMQSAKLAGIGRVTAGIAHEINNPLNNISLTAEVLLEDLPNLDCGERLDMVRDVLMQADRAREVVRHLLDFSRSRRPSAWEPVDLCRLVDASLTLLRNQVRIAQIEISTDLAAEPVMVMGNPNQLQQVLVNIILNALQAMSPGGRLSLAVNAEPERRRATVVISDTGPGIAKADQAQIFDPFFTTKNEGTGLGLSVSYGIVKEHNGDIELESAPEEGKIGTTFRIVLPLREEE